MSLVCGVIQISPRSAASARTAAKNSRGTAVTNRGQTYRSFQSRWIAVAQRDGMTWSPPTGSSTLRVAATGASCAELLVGVALRGRQVGGLVGAPSPPSSGWPCSW